MMLRAMMLRPIRLVAVCVLALVSISAQAKDISDLRRKAEAGDAKAQFDLADAYSEGKGVAKDPEQGIVWLRRSASQGFAGAELTLGIMYQTAPAGFKINKDAHEAASWYRKAARQSNIDDKHAKTAQTRLSEMLGQGLISSKEANWQAPEPVAVPVKAVPVKEVKKNKATPFSLIEVDTGLSGGITTKRMATLVSTYGVDFTLNAGAKKRLADDGADDNLLQTIASSKR